MNSVNVSDAPKKTRHKWNNAVTVNGKMTPRYQAWHNMRGRCLDKNHKDYGNYGGRGVTICQAWINSFDAFCEDMGPRPSGMTLERENNDKGYGPDNCKWASRKVQASNRRGRTVQPTGPRKPLTFNGKTQSMEQWARDLGLRSDTLHARLKRHGWTIQEALTTPAREWLHASAEETSKFKDLNAIHEAIDASSIALVELGAELDFEFGQEAA